MTRAVLSEAPGSDKTPLSTSTSSPIAFAIVGSADSGKTRLAAALVREFKLMPGNLRIAAIKHCPHGHKVDKCGSDTSRLKDAGADTVVAASPGSVATIAKVEGDIEPEELITRLSIDHDVLIVEGYESSSLPKVLVRAAAADPFVERPIVAIVGSSGEVESDIAHFSSSNVSELAGWIMTNPALRLRTPLVSLLIDGKPVNMKRFPSSALVGILTGFVDSLNDIPARYDRIEITMSSMHQCKKVPGS